MFGDNTENPTNPNPGDVNLGEIHVGYWLCHICNKPMHFRKGKCIQCILDAVPWKNEDKVRVKATGEVGDVVYRYYNGYTCIDIGKPIKGGVLNNDSTYKNDELELHERI